VHNSAQGETSVWELKLIMIGFSDNKWRFFFSQILIFLIILVHFFQALRPFISYYTFGLDELQNLDQVFTVLYMSYYYTFTALHYYQ